MSSTGSKVLLPVTLNLFPEMDIAKVSMQAVFAAPGMEIAGFAGEIGHLLTSTHYLQDGVRDPVTRVRFGLGSPEAFDYKNWMKALAIAVDGVKHLSSERLFFDLSVLERTDFMDPNHHFCQRFAEATRATLGFVFGEAPRFEKVELYVGEVSVSTKLMIKRGLE